MAVKAVIFDLDGTLYDNSRLIPELIVRSLKNLHWLAAERLTRRSMAGKAIPNAYDELFHNMAELTHGDASKARQWFYTVYMPLQASVLSSRHHVKPWVIPTLKALKAKGILVACLSDYYAVHEKLTALGIDPALFDLVTDAPSEGGMKPCAEAFLSVAAKLGVEPGEVLVVGDRQNTDGAGAAAAGMQFHLVPRTDTDTIGLDLDKLPQELVTDQAKN